MTRNLTLILLLICAAMGFSPAVITRSDQGALQTPATTVSGPGRQSTIDDQLSTASNTVADNAINIDTFYPDHRAWQHGINLVPVGSRHLLVWSSWGNPPAPQPNPEKNWEHDVYYAWIDPAHPALDIHTLASEPEAQEPASAAINSQGRILMSCEDGYGEINQHAGLWDAGLNPIKPFPFTIRDGGHSGHVAALGDKFLVVYSEGWIDGGGVDDLGTGDDVWADIVDNDGNTSREIPTSVDPSPDKRDWWPVVAASDRNWLEVWQRYPSATLHGALITPDGTIQHTFQITDQVKFYYYNITYLPGLHLYAVFGSRQDGGFVSLVDPDGKVVLTKTGLPDTVRESRLIAREEGSGVTAVYPTLPSGAAVLRITPQAVTLARTVEDSYDWDYMGTDGLFVNPQKVLFATLSKQGVQFITIDL